MKGLHRGFIAVLGGTGASGLAVVRELIAVTPHSIRVGARGEARLRACCAELGDRVSPWPVDVGDPARLQAFVDGASVVVNASGPAIEIEDRVARAALHARAHYLDLGGYDLLEERLRPDASSIEALGLSFAIGCGWMPGLSGAFPMHVDAAAASHLDRIDALRIFYGARDAWGEAASRDMVWSVFQSWAGEFRDGKWRPSRLFTRGERVALPEPFGKQRAMPFFDNQLREFARDRRYPLFGAYVCELSALSTAVFLGVRLLGNPRSALAARAVRAAIARDARRLGRGGIVHVRIDGVRARQPAFVVGTLASPDNHRITGLVAAAAVDAALTGRLRKGVHYLCEAVEPPLLLAPLHAAGVRSSIVDDRGTRLDGERAEAQRDRPASLQDAAP
jgi:Saccharopine dehydrogenase NADP binding domain